MALERKDSVADTSTTTGAGTLTLLGAAPAGRLTFAASGLTTGATVRYRIASLDESEWEVGEGVWTSSGATLTRATVFKSSNSGSAVSFSAGTKTVSLASTVKDHEDLTDRFVKVMVRNATGGTSTATSWNKIPFDTVDSDSSNLWDNTNKKVTPTKEGWYQCNVQARVTSSTGLTCGVRKNGGTYYLCGAECVGAVSAGGSVMVYCNGSTDYIEPSVYTVASRTYSTVTGEQYFQVVGPF